MTKAEYFVARRKLSFEPSLPVTTVLLVCDLLLLSGSVWLISHPGGPAHWLGQLLLAVFYFHNFALLHECGHGNVHRHETTNAVIGHYASLFCFLPYFPWKDIHREHHSWTGNLEKDPTLKKVRQMKLAGKVPLIVRLAWWSWIPVAALLQHFVFWGYPFAAWREGKLRGRQLYQSAFSVAFLAAAVSLWILYAPPAVALVNIWPSLLAYLICVELVNLPHHLGMPTLDGSATRKKLYLWEQNHTTRTCWYPGLISELFVLNFNLHTEHHFFPTLPWYRLKAAREVIRPHLEGEYHQTTGVEWNLINRSRDPQDLILAPPQMPKI